MNHKKRTSLLSAKIGTDSSNYVNHYTSWPSSFICDNNENDFIQGIQPGSFYWYSCPYDQGCNRKYHHMVGLSRHYYKHAYLFTEVWGESVSQLTTNEKRSFNDDKANTIGFKVDARFIAKPRLLDDNVVDTSNMEAARCLDDPRKVFNDKTKLVIETKILLDNVVCNCNPTSIKKLQVLNIQICGVEAEVCCMTLADSGLYIHNYAYNISLPCTLNLFAENCIDWIRRLVTFKKSCLHLAELPKAFTSNHSRTFDHVFSRESSPSQPHATCNFSWVRGTFFPSTKADPIPRFPKHFLSSPVLASKRKDVDGPDKTDVKKRK